MRKALRHTGVLMMIAVLALGLVGAAYTLWYEDLKLHADITTGDFDVDWSCKDVDDVPINPDEAEAEDFNDPCRDSELAIVSLDNGETYNKAGDEVDGREIPRDKLPQCDIHLSDNPAADNAGQGDDNVLNLELNELYPYSGCLFAIDIHNDGTVPAHLTLTDVQSYGIDLSNFTIVATGGKFYRGSNGAEVTTENFDICQIYHFPWCPDDDDNSEATAACEAIFNNISIGAANVDENEGPLQLHAGDKLICGLRITLNQANVENTTASFDLTFRAHQWNESADGGPGEVGNRPEEN